MIIGFSVKLLFNQNLSPKLPRWLGDLYPGSIHVQDINLDAGKDIPIWNHARSRDFVIVTKDKDYLELSSRLGHPPKVVLLRLPNKTKPREMESLLRERYGDILTLHQDDSRGLLELP